MLTKKEKKLKQRKRKQLFSSMDVKGRAHLRGRLVTVIVACLASLSLVAVGVVATLGNFAVAVTHDIFVEINNVDGTLSATRSGGIIASLDGDYTYPNGYAQNAVAVDFDGVLYDTQNGVNSNKELLERTRLNVNHKYSSIEYIYKFQQDAEAETNTSITIAQEHGNVAGMITSYQYCYASSIDENTTWSNYSSSLVVDSDSSSIFIRTSLEIDFENITNSSIEFDWEYTLSFVPVPIVV